MFRAVATLKNFVHRRRQNFEIAELGLLDNLEGDGCANNWE